MGSWWLCRYGLILPGGFGLDGEKKTCSWLPQLNLDCACWKAAAGAAGLRLLVLM
jgi:hypothetical protein